jgi:Flp pilus assembly protein TadD
MLRFLTILAMALFLSSTAACSTVPSSPTQSTGLDDLFRRLRTTSSDAEAEMIEAAIRNSWASSGVPSIDALVVHAAEAAHVGNYDEALVFLDRVVDAAPHFAEGWNLRATVHYLQDDYAAAILDIQRVLALEPRHFGALVALGRIMEEMEDKKAALWAYDRALAINPHLGDVRDEADELRDQLAGLPI